MPFNEFVELSRRFVPAERDKLDESQEYARELGLIDGTLGWNELLDRRRVVLLAEGGSGKSTELEEQARQRRAAGEFAFFATIQNVARAGFDTALHTSHADLQAWRASNKPAWFFLDSVDEAKSGQVRLRDALKVIAQGIKGAEGRAHIVLSGRHSDWEARATWCSWKRRSRCLHPMRRYLRSTPARSLLRWCAARNLGRQRRLKRHLSF